METGTLAVPRVSHAAPACGVVPPVGNVEGRGDGELRLTDWKVGPTNGAIALTKQPDVILYTDGACSGNPGPGGWAVILKHTETGKIKKLTGSEPHTTNNRMELMAVLEALRSLKDSKRWRVKLVSDSQYVILGLTEWIEGWMANGWRRGKKPTSPPVKNVDLWKELHALTQRHDMTYEHVRGHAGHPENEECDRLAVAAIETGRRDRLE